MPVLLTRDDFRNSCLERDDYRCVFCGSADDLSVHHIIERRLFDDGGYYMENGATVCELHHLLCEQTVISVEQVRQACGIRCCVLPEHFYEDQIYDKWGNIILDNGQRLRGELFEDSSVQKILNAGNVLHLFTKYVKYPRTHHLPWSLGMHEDDRMHASISQWFGKKVLVSIKYDGENTSMYRDYCHARSVSSGNHPSRGWIKAFHASICGDIPEGYRVCAENLYATHSIHYKNLPSYCIGFAIYDEKNTCLDWDSTVEWFKLLGISCPEILYVGIFDESIIKNIKLNYSEQEGYVLRLYDSFSYRDFRKYVGKFVRPDHIKTTKHWLHGQPVVPNEIKK